MIFYLRHAPVVLVHGLWAHSDTWSLFGLTHDPDILYRNEIVLSDWDGVSSIQTAASQVKTDLTHALEQMRMQGIAASGVDVVAHSMGGLVAKQIAHDNPTLVHKLITLDTPNFGSALADLIVTARTFPIVRGAIPSDNGAIDDLRPVAGANARRVNTGKLRAHSIVGVASDDEPCQATQKNVVPSWVAKICLVPFIEGFLSYEDCKRGLLTRTFNNRQNDEIVDVDSQRGGFSRAISEFSSGGATGQHTCVAAHMNMTSDITRDVSQKIKTLLDTNRMAAVFEEYDLSSASLVGQTQSGAAPSAVSLGLQQAAASGAISIEAPIDGQIVTPGSVIDVAITAPSSFVGAYVLTPDQILSVPTQPLRVQATIPPDAIGQYAIGVRADTAAGESATASITLNVVPNAAVTSLIVNPLEVFLNVGDTVKPFVRGVFADGVTRDLSRSAAVAFASSNTAIVSALPDGTLKATGAGSARITVFSGTASAELLINVESIPKRRAVNH